MSAPTPGPFGSLKCGCTVQKLGEWIDLEYCDAHRAGPGLLALLKEMVEYIEERHDVVDNEEDRADPSPNWAMQITNEFGERYEAAIRKAGGK